MADNTKCYSDKNNLSNESEVHHLTLTEEKKYHLFFSHSSEDEVAIIPILDLLEAAPYNLTCCIGRRDFMLGEPLTMNINYALNQSLGTVVFLTPNFLQSGYCKHEIETAFTMYMEGEGKVIPVILKPCKVPNEFRTIHYIDEGIPEKLAERIYTSLITDTKDTKKNLPLNPIQAGQTRINGNRFIVSVSDILDRNEEEQSKKENFVTHQQKRDFERLGIKVDDVLMAILKVAVFLPIYKPYYRKHRGIFLLYSPLANMIALSSIVGVLAIVMYLVMEPVDSALETFEMYLGITLGAICFFCFAIPFFYIQKDIYRSKKCLSKLNQYSLQDKSCCFKLTATKLNIPVVLTVVKYDLTDCKKFLERKYVAMQEDSKTTFDKIWTDLIKSKLYSKYFKRLRNETLQPMNDDRHIVVNEKVCLCQFLEIHNYNMLQAFSNSEVDEVSDSVSLKEVNIDNGVI